MIAIKIQSAICRDYFYPDQETLAISYDGYFTKGDFNTCDKFFEM
jgi:hypothetical protein